MAKSVKRSMALKGNTNAKGHAKVGTVFASIGGPFGAVVGGRNAAKVAAKKNGPFVKETAKGTSTVGAFHGSLTALAFSGNPLLGAAIGAASYATLTYAGSKIPIQHHARHKN